MHGGRWRAGLLDDRGQGTVEYAAVFVGLLAVVVALGALAKAGESGVLNQTASTSFSHSIDGAARAEGLADASLY